MVKQVKRLFKVFAVAVWLVLLLAIFPSESQECVVSLRRGFVGKWYAHELQPVWGDSGADDSDFLSTWWSSLRCCHGKVFSSREVADSEQNRLSYVPKSNLNRFVYQSCSKADSSSILLSSNKLSEKGYGKQSSMLLWVLLHFIQLHCATCYREFKGFVNRADTSYSTLVIDENQKQFQSHTVQSLKHIIVWPCFARCRDAEKP